MKFKKMHGLGNDFVIVDIRDGAKLPAKAQIAALSDRRTGIGCDQFITIEPSTRADVFMRIMNGDGSEAEACGNATRCVADIVMKEKGSDKIVIETVAGLLDCAAAPDGGVTVDMGVPKFGWQDIPLSRDVDTLNMPIAEGAVGVNIGNPHAVFFVNDVEHLDIGKLGPPLENHPLFPKKSNIEFVQVLNAQTLRMRVWERGAGETQACGSGACAALVAASRRHFTGRKAKVILDGGTLNIEWRESDDHILMTGPVAYVFEGFFTPDV